MPRIRLVEPLMMLLVLAGFANCIDRFVTDGKLPQPFIFDINDTFMDWFNTAYFAHHEGAFSVWRTIYPPLSFAFLRVFGIGHCYASESVAARDCDWIGIVSILGSYVLCAVLAAVVFRRNDRATALYRSIGFGLGLPILFTLERGNLILVTFIFFAIAQSDLTTNRWVRAMCIGVTINFKPYMLVPALAPLFRRKWRSLELAAIATVMVYFVSYAMVGAGSVFEIYSNITNWVSFASVLIWEQVYFSTSYTPILGFDTAAFPTRDFIASETVDLIMTAIPLLINFSLLLVALSLLGVWLQPQAVTQQRVALLIFAAYLINQSPGGYILTFFIFLLFLERWQSVGPKIAIVMGYLLCVPYDYVLGNFITLEGDSWLSGRPVTSPFGLTVGIFARPGLLILLTWALAFDTIAKTIRAKREHAPTLDPRPIGVASRLQTVA